MRIKIKFLRQKNRHGHKKGISRRVIDRENEEFYALQKNIQTDKKVAGEDWPLDNV